MEKVEMGGPKIPALFRRGGHGWETRGRDDGSPYNAHYKQLSQPAANECVSSELGSRTGLPTFPAFRLMDPSSQNDQEQAGQEPPQGIAHQYMKKY
jgi:hypothetical protein